LAQGPFEEARAVGTMLLTQVVLCLSAVLSSAEVSCDTVELLQSHLVRAAAKSNGSSTAPCSPTFLPNSSNVTFEDVKEVTSKEEAFKLLPSNFYDLDKDQSGDLNLSEIHFGMFESIKANVDSQQLHPTSEGAIEYLNTNDADMSGTISLEEFQASLVMDHEGQFPVSALSISNPVTSRNCLSKVFRATQIIGGCIVPTRVKSCKWTWDWSWGAFKRLGECVVEVVTEIVSCVRETWDYIQDSFDTCWKSIVSATRGPVELVNQAFGPFIDLILDVTDNCKTWEECLKYFTENTKALLERITTFIYNSATVFIDNAASLLNSTWQGLQSLSLGMKRIGTEAENEMSQAQNASIQNETSQWCVKPEEGVAALNVTDCGAFESLSKLSIWSLHDAGQHFSEAMQKIQSCFRFKSIYNFTTPFVDKSLQSEYCAPQFVQGPVESVSAAISAALSQDSSSCASGACKLAQNLSTMTERVVDLFRGDAVDAVDAVLLQAAQSVNRSHWPSDPCAEASLDFHFFVTVSGTATVYSLNRKAYKVSVGLEFTVGCGQVGNESRGLMGDVNFKVSPAAGWKFGKSTEPGMADAGIFLSIGYKHNSAPRWADPDGRKVFVGQGVSIGIGGWKPIPQFPVNGISISIPSTDWALQTPNGFSLSFKLEFGAELPQIDGEDSLLQVLGGLAEVNVEEALKTQVKDLRAARQASTAKDVGLRLFVWYSYRVCLTCLLKNGDTTQPV